MNNNITILSGPKNWMDSLAVDQATALGGLEGVKSVFAMPDLHAGKTPVGVTVVTEERIYPHIIGGDIGCGMNLYDTGIGTNKLKPEKWAAKLNTIKTLAAVPNVNYFADCPIPDFGTIGGGNHFAEFQTVSRLGSAEAFAALGLREDRIYMTVHSGSRSYGARILKKFADYNGYDSASAEGAEYVRLHDDAAAWAAKNRDEAAVKLVGYLGFGADCAKKLECAHNFLELRGREVYHRKGTVSADNGAVIIAGSRGTLSYIVLPTRECAAYGRSLSHGSGRKWARSMCKSRIKDKYTAETIKRNKYKGFLVCHDLELVYQEAPDAYKNIETVIEILRGFGLIEVVAALTPVLTFKG